MDAWAKGMEINVATMVLMAKYAIPEMVKNEGQWRGSIVNMASVAGLKGGTPHLLYPTSKGAIVVRLVLPIAISETIMTTMTEHDSSNGHSSRC